MKPDVIREKDFLEKQIIFNKPNEEEMKEWLVNHKGFSATKVANGLERLQKCQGKKNQTRLDCFFKATITSSSSAPKVNNKKL